jgi:hypothetical protein
VLASLVRGLSVPDVEAALAEALGPRRPSASRRCAGSARRSKRSSTPSPPATSAAERWTPCSWTAPLPRSPGGACRADPGRMGVTTSGGPVLLGLAPGSHEAPIHGWVPGGPGRPRAGCAAAGHHRRRARAVERRGAGVPTLAAATLPDPPCPQRPGQGPNHAQAEVKQAFWQSFDDIDAPPGDRRSTRPAAAPPPSPTATSTATRPRSPACWTPCPS